MDDMQDALSFFRFFVLVFNPITEEARIVVSCQECVSFVRPIRDGMKLGAHQLGGCMVTLQDIWLLHFWPFNEIKHRS